jgi:hypothetical protein
MTFQQIHKDVAKKRPCSRRSIFRYLKQAKVKPTTRHVRPALYPEDAPEKIFKLIGLDDFPSIRQLRAVRSKALGARRAA